MKQQIVFIDVDDTLVRSVGTKRIPMPSVIAQVRRLYASGAALFLWSSGGADYCRKTAEELGLTECFTGYLPKPTRYIDDQPVQEWRDCLHLYPMQATEA
jgi:hydroxymethylpyrimidine pyrophosphatase-like HAD family hydrolase